MDFDKHNQDIDAMCESCHRVIEKCYTRESILSAMMPLIDGLIEQILYNCSIPYVNDRINKKKQKYKKKEYGSIIVHHDFSSQQKLLIDELTKYHFKNLIVLCYTIKTDGDISRVFILEDDRKLEQFSQFPDEKFIVIMSTGYNMTDRESIFILRNLKKTKQFIKRTCNYNYLIKNTYNINENSLL